MYISQKPYSLVYLYYWLELSKMNIFKILRFVIDTRNWGFYWLKQIKWGVFFFLGGSGLGGHEVCLVYITESLTLSLICFMIM